MSSQQKKIIRPFTSDVESTTPTESLRLPSPPKTLLDDVRVIHPPSLNKIKRKIKKQREHREHRKASSSPSSSTSSTSSSTQISTIQTSSDIQDKNMFNSKKERNKFLSKILLKSKKKIYKLAGCLLTPFLLMKLVIPDLPFF